MTLEHAELTEQIIGACITVHKALGPGFLESIYENALVIELRARGLFIEQQVEVPISFKGHQVGKHRLDLLVEKLIVVELKTVKDFENIHFAITRSYLRSLNLKHGLLINFAQVQVETKRVMVRDQ
jgi:GxxExxY protein